VQTTAVSAWVYIEYRKSYLGPVDPSFRALSGRLKFTVRRHKSIADSLSGPVRIGQEPCRAPLTRADPQVLPRAGRLKDGRSSTDAMAFYRTVKTEKRTRRRGPPTLHIVRFSVHIERFFVQIVRVSA